MESIENQRATIQQILDNLMRLKDDTTTSKKKKTNNKAGNALIVCINKKLPISCDVLNLGWMYECTISKRAPLEAIESVCEDAFEFPINKRDWIWFERYILKSRVESPITSHNESTFPFFCDCSLLLFCFCFRHLLFLCFFGILNCDRFGFNQ